MDGGRAPQARSPAEDWRAPRRFPVPRFRTTFFWYEPTRIAEARASCRYRIGNLVDHLPGATALVGTKLSVVNHLPVRTLCCVRPLASASFEQQLRDLRRRGARLVADFDDLLFGGPVEGLPPWAGGVGARGSEANRQLRYVKALDLFDEVTVATGALAERVSCARPKVEVTVVPNGISESWARRGEACRRWAPGDPRVVRYLSGSPSHDADFATVAPVLRAFLRRHANVRLEVLGPVRVDTSTFPSGQIRHLPRIRPFDELPSILASSWLAIAPLAPTPYNECKSAIKFLESAVFGCPVIASPNQDLRRHASLGAPVVICESADAWYGALEAMLDDDLRMRTGTMSRMHVARHGMAGQSARLWSETVGA